jgi:hypothetical protein
MKNKTCKYLFSNPHLLEKSSHPCLKTGKKLRQ